MIFGEPVEFIPFKVYHGFRMDWIDKEDFLELYKNNPQIFEIMEAQGQTYTFVQGASILGLLTIMEIHPRHAQISLAMSKAIQSEFNIRVYKAMKTVIKQVSARYPRVSGEGKASNQKLNKLMKKLGFKQEGLMKNYGFHGEDHYLWAITREE